MAVLPADQTVSLDLAKRRPHTDADRLAERAPMDWLVRLGGDEWSLQGLCEQLRSDPRVWKDDDGHYYLSSPALTACADDDGAWREAELTIARTNDWTSGNVRFQPKHWCALVTMAAGARP